jgi:hypothetical protein
MGSYAGFEIDGFELFSSKSYAVGSVMTIFTEGDRTTYIASREDEDLVRREVDVSGITDTVELDLPDDECLVVRYRAPLAVVRDRLDAMGITIGAARARVERLLTDDAESTDDESPPLRAAGSAPTFEDWVEGLRYVRDLPSRWSHEAERRSALESSDVPRLANAMADSVVWPFDDEDDPRTFVRAALEAWPDDAVVEYDLTHVVGGGWYRPDEAVAADAMTSILRTPAHHPTIILTEGSSDTWILEGALRVLAPHLVGYYRFLDQTAFNSPGGTATLVAMVKAFAAAGIANRVIAIFDNDAAGTAAYRSLLRESLPGSIRCLQLPDTALAREYPTVGPGGSQVMDVNGTAGSIELYLGKDVLMTADGGLSPVVWRSLDHTSGLYQGEIRNKRLVHEGFRRKLAEAGRTGEVGPEWSDLRAVISLIRGADDP